MNLKKILTAGTVACMIAVTGCSSNIPENNQGNRNGMRLTASANDAGNGAAARTNRSRSTWNLGNRNATRSKTTRSKSTARTNNARANNAKVNTARSYNNLNNGTGSNLNGVTRNSNSAYSNNNIDRRARNSVSKGYSDYDANNFYNRNRNYNTGNTNTFNRSNVNRSASAPVYRENRASNAERLNRSTIGNSVAPRATMAPRATTAPRSTVAPRSAASPRATMAPRATVSPRSTVNPGVTVPRATLRPRVTAAPRTTPAPANRFRNARTRLNNRMSNARLDNNGVVNRNFNTNRNALDSASRTINNYDFNIARGSDRYVSDRFNRGKLSGLNTNGSLALNDLNDETVLAMANTSQSINVKASELDDIIDKLTEIRNDKSTGTTVNRSATRSSAKSASKDSAAERKKNSVWGGRHYIQTIYVGKPPADDSNKTTINRSSNSKNSSSVNRTRSSSSKKRSSVNRSSNKSNKRTISGDNYKDYRPSRHSIDAMIKKATASENKKVIDGRSMPVRKIINEALKMK